MKKAIPPKPFKNKKELAGELGICVKTLTKKLNRKGYKIPRGLIAIKDQEQILKTLGISEDSLNGSGTQRD